MKKKNIANLTTAGGMPVDNDQSSINTGAVHGHTLMQDMHLTEKLAHFNRERIPERVVHAKGAGAHGVFEACADMSKYTCADFLKKAGKKTDVFARFSTVGGEKGSADTARDPRGFAVKFYTDEGNYDMVGNNTPVFFIRDAIKFPDFIHTQKRNPQTNLKDPDMFWDFLSLTPESVHQVTILFSDRGTPRGYHLMDGHSSHTYMWYNKKKEYVWVKYHFKTNQGYETLSGPEADALAGGDPDYCTKSLFETIAKRKFPSWDVCVQIMTPKQAESYKFDPFDVTKVWYHKDFPLIKIGKMTLNKNPENYFAEVEQAAFAPSNTVPGIWFSPDKMLQGRIFAYADTQRWRLGANYQQIPINAPKCPMAHNQRDGMMNVLGNGGSAIPSFPSTLNPLQTDEKFAPPSVKVEGLAARQTPEVGDVDYVQAGELYRRVLNGEHKAHLVNNLVGHMSGIKNEAIKYRQCAVFYRADKDYGTNVAKGLKLDVKRVAKLAAMTPEERLKETKL